MKYRTQLDISSDISINEFLDLIEEHSSEEEMMEMKLLEISGPGGGNPVFEFSHSNRNNVSSLMNEVTGDDQYSKEFPPIAS